MTKEETVVLRVVRWGVVTPLLLGACWVVVLLAAATFFANVLWVGPDPNRLPVPGATPEEVLEEIGPAKKPPVVGQDI